MKSLTYLIREQVRIGTSIALFCGISVGALLGFAIITIQNAHLIFPTVIASVAALFFITSTSALINMAVFLPLEFIIAASILIWPSIRRIHFIRFYTSTFIIGCLFIFIFLWISFKLIRNPYTPAVMSIYFLLASAALSSLFFINKVQRKSSENNITWFNNKKIIISVAFCVATTVISYAYLNSFSAEIVVQSKTISDLQKNSTHHSSNTSISARNVILISIDTLRADHLSSYGYQRTTTPSIDQLTENGVAFLNTFSQAPWTLPSHATMLTSLYPTSHGARFSSQHAPVLDKLDDRHLTIAEIFSAAGYETAAFTSVSWLSKPWGLLQGFSTSQMFDSFPFTATSIVDYTIQWLTNNDEKPFFLFLHIFDVHDYKSPPPFDSLYNESKINTKLRDLKSLTSLTSMNGFYRMSEDDLKYLIAKYDSALNYVDCELGRLFAWLRSRSSYDKTMIIVTSDHGEEFWEHKGTGRGFTLYKEALHVPLILKLLPEDHIYNKNIYREVGVIDILPTILDYVGIQRPSFLEGLTLKPLIEESMLPARVLFAEDTYWLNSYAIIQNGYKYIENNVPPGELFNPLLFYVNIRSFFKFRKNELYHIEDAKEQLNLLQKKTQLGNRMHSDLLKHIKIENIGERGVIDKETQEKLRSLGYIQ